MLSVFVWPFDFLVFAVVLCLFDCVFDLSWLTHGDSCGSELLAILALFRVEGSLWPLLDR